MVAPTQRGHTIGEFTWLANKNKDGSLQIPPQTIPLAILESFLFRNLHLQWQHILIKVDKCGAEIAKLAMLLIMSTLDTWQGT